MGANRRFNVGKTLEGIIRGVILYKQTTFNFKGLSEEERLERESALFYWQAYCLVADGLARWQDLGFVTASGEIPAYDLDVISIIRNFVADAEKEKHGR